MPPTTPELAVAINAARAAGEMIAKRFHEGIEFRSKVSQRQRFRVVAAP